ncbi:MAG: S8 family serine peptidase [bacterium]|nr:S8 family serine peptidase [bacterium]
MYKKPQLRFFLVLTAFLAVFLVSSNIALAVSKNSNLENGRYLISTKSYFIKSLFGVQHEFDSGFTADLTSGEVWTLEKIFKINVVPVPLYKINSIEVVDTVSANVDGVVSETVASLQKDAQKIKDRDILPTAGISWGVATVYNDDFVTSTSGGKGVNVAVLDTGVNVSHPDLVSDIKDCKDFTRGSVPRSACEDKNGHGTHVAGIIAGDGGFDAKGIWGVASEANLLVYKVCRNDGTCWADDVASALDYAANIGKADIAFMGLGGNSESSVLKNSINSAWNKNILIITGAGNDGPDKASIDWPAAYKNSVAVGALTEDKITATWSSRGVNDGDYIKEEREVSFIAPGVNIESTWVDGGYRFLSGTSMSAAFVSGLAAKIWNGSATNTMTNLEELSRDVGLIGDDNATGFGVIVLPRSKVETPPVFLLP